MRISRAFKLAAVLAAILSLISPMPASAAGTISGTVTDPSGAPVANAYINIWTMIDEGLNPVDESGMTDSSGNYSIDLPPGEYKINVFSFGTGLVDTWYNDKPSLFGADWVTIADGAETGVDLQLRYPGQISGRLTDPSGSPLDNGTVTAWRHEINPYDGQAFWYAAQYAGTNSNGEYTLTDLYPGDYVVSFSDSDESRNNMGEYYSDKPDADAGDSVSVAEGAATTGVDSQLSTGGYITGRVTDASGNPIAGAEVSLYQAAGGSTSWSYVKSRSTDSSGEFSVNKLSTDQYKLFVVQENGDYAGEYYADETTLADADSIGVTLGAETNVGDIALAEEASITGTVTDQNGDPVSETKISVYAEDSGGSWERVRFENGRSDGTYSIGELPAGAYKVKVEEYYGILGPKYFDDSATLAGADQISLSAGGGAVADFVLEDTYADAFEPDDGMSSAAPIATDGTRQSHSISPIGDEDWETFTGVAGETYTIGVVSQDWAMHADTYIYDSSGNEMEHSYEGGHEADSLITFTPTVTGAYYIRNRQWHSADGGTYELYVSGPSSSDTTPPTAPEASISSSGGEILLSWTAASDSESGVSAYRVYDGDTDALLIETAGLTYSTGGSGASNFYVKAVDVAGNESSESNAVSVAATAAGTDVNISFEGGISLTFSSVTTAGSTGLSTSSSPPASNSGFEVNGVYYDFVTTAGYSGTITVTLPYDPATTTDPSILRIYHYVGGTPVEVPTSIDTTAHTVSGEVTSFSWFAVGTPSTYVFGGFNQPINADGSSIFQLGRTIPVKFRLYDLDGQNAAGATAKIYLSKISNGIAGSELELISSGAPDLGNYFRYDAAAQQYIFNLGTKGLSPGTWKIRVATGDGLSHIVFISLRD